MILLNSYLTVWFTYLGTRRGRMLEWNVGKNHFTISISMVAGNKVHHGSKKLQLDQSFLKIKEHCGIIWNLSSD